MADIELVVKIDEKDYQSLKDGHIPFNVLDSIRNAIQLPEGHGRLIDADRLKSMYSINRGNFNTVVGIQKWIDDAETILEAESEEKE